jgi:uncharacterized protein (DUF2126 family)
VFAQKEATKVVAEKTEADAVTGTVTFATNIDEIEIINLDSTNAGVFTINGIAIHVEATETRRVRIGGTAAKTVAVTGATKYVLTQYAQQ